MYFEKDGVYIWMFSDADLLLLLIVLINKCHLHLGCPKTTTFRLSFLTLNIIE